MRICVVGWYFDKDFMDALGAVHHKYPVTIISHKKDIATQFPTVEISNVGLEWGAYSYYLQNVWTDDSVLFTHDDTKIFDISVFDAIAQIDYDCSMLFRTVKENKCNVGVHGRCFKCSERFLRFYKDYDCKCKFCQDPHKGFWYDASNCGTIDDGGDEGKNQDINRGTYHMKAIMEKLHGETDFTFNPSIVFNYFYGFRGKLGIDGLTAEINSEKYSLPKDYGYTL